jgi:hypothetical protein
LASKKGKSNKNSKDNEKVTKKQVRDMFKTFSTRTIPKLFTTVVNNASVTSAFVGPIQQISPNAGVGPYNRVSDSIRIRYVDHRMVMYAGDVQNVIRIIAIQMKATSVLSVNDLMFSGPSGSRDILSFINPYSEKQFHLLFDKSFVLASGGSNSAVYLNFRVIPKIKTWDYSSGTNTINSGQIYYYFVSDSDVVPSPVLEWNSMIEFDDDL